MYTVRNGSYPIHNDNFHLMVKNSHGVSSKNNPKKTPKTKKRLAAKRARKDAQSKKK